MRERVVPAARAAVLPAVVVVSCALVLVVLAGADPATALGAMVDGMVGTPYDVGSALNAAAVTALVGAGFVVAARVGLFNVGGEGQISAGALLAAAVGLHLPGPTAAVVAATLLAGAAGGAAWAGIAAALRRWRGTSEVLSTLLLNFIGVAAVSLAVHETWLLRQPITSSATLPQSPALPGAAHLPLAQPGGPATIAVVLAVVVLVALALVLRHGSLGLAWCAVGASAAAARRLGLPAAALSAGALVLSGALGGLAGASLVASSPFVLQEGLSSGYGFQGLVVGLLARGSMVGVALAALLLGLLNGAGLQLQLQAGVPAAAIGVLEAVIVLVLAAGALRRRSGTTTGAAA